MKEASARFLVLFSTLLCIAAAKDIYVSPSGNDNSSGTQDAPFASISHAVAVARTGDAIFLLRGSYSVSTTIQIVGKSLRLATASGLQDATISLPARNGTSIFSISDNATVSMDGLILVGARGNGSCVVVSESTLALSSVEIRDCQASASRGGAVSADAGSSLFVVDCVFTRNTAHQGGAVFSAGEATVLNGVFSGNIADFSPAVFTQSGYSYGGAIFNAGSMQVEGCTFEHNAASFLTASSLDIMNAYGGAFYNAGAANMSRCTFASNNASYWGSFSPRMYSSGGAFYNAGTANVDTCLFTDNIAASLVAESHDAYSSGGAIYNSGSTNLTDCTFSRNAASSTTHHLSPFFNTGFSDGGALYNTRSSFATIVRCTFANNLASAAQTPIATTSGGAIFNAGTTTAINCSLAGNAASSIAAPSIQQQSATSNGGALFNSGFATLIMTRLANNTCISSVNSSSSSASSRGGALSNKGTVNLADCVFAANSGNASSHSSSSWSQTFGGAIYTWYRANVDRCEFSSNTAFSSTSVFDQYPGSFGGALFTSGTTRLSRCNFERNTASAKALSAISGLVAGGAIYSFSGPANVSECTFLSNVASSSDVTSNFANTSLGGAIASGSTLFLTLSSSSLSNNLAAFGGGVYVATKKLSVVNCTLTNNTATEDWGAISTEGGSGQSCVFKCNRAKGNTVSYPVNLTCDECTILPCIDPTSNTSQASTVPTSSATTTGTEPFSTSVQESSLSWLWALIIIPIGLAIGFGWWFLRSRRLSQQQQQHQSINYVRLNGEEQ